MPACCMGSVECPSPPRYVNILAVHTEHRGCGYGKQLLSAVARWADEDKVECYLECSEGNVAIYKRCGYEVVWNEMVRVEDEDESPPVMVFGMARKPLKWV